MAGPDDTPRPDDLLVVDDAPQTAAADGRTDGAAGPTPVAPRGAEPPQPPGTGSAFGQVFKVLGSLVAPASFLTALLFYFGWAHVQFFWRYFGLDPSLLDFAVQDYLLRSADALFVPLLGLALLTLALLGGHGLVERWRTTYGTRRVAHAVVVVLVPVGSQLVLLGFARIRWPGLHLVMHFLVPSTALGIGVVLLAYAGHLLAVSRQVSPPAGLVPARVLQAAAVSLIVALALFWATVDYALEVGEARARQFAAELDVQPGVVIHSAQRLQLTGPGVEETACDPEAAYPYRYHGLKLMLRSGNQYFLLPEEWSRRDGVAIVLPASADHRLEYTVGSGTTDDPGPC